MSTVEVNGIGLEVEVRGEGPPLLLLHGFTGSHGTWDPLVRAWSGHTTIAVDVIGHGRSESPEDPRRYSMERCVEDLGALLDELGVARTSVLGYSMGGRIALHLALLAPERVESLVLEGASPGIDDEGERAARVESDNALADRIEREGIAAFVDYWESLPLFASQRSLPAAEREGLRCQRLRNDPRGLANGLRGMGAGSQEPLSRRLCEIEVPVLLIAGAEDEKYRSLVKAMASKLANSKVEIVPDAGHAAHLEQPERFAAAVRDFLAGCLEKKEE